MFFWLEISPNFDICRGLIWKPNLGDKSEFEPFRCNSLYHKTRSSTFYTESSLFCEITHRVQTYRRIFIPFPQKTVNSNFWAQFSTLNTFLTRPRKRSFQRVSPEKQLFGGFLDQDTHLRAYFHRKHLFRRKFS